MPVSLYIGKLIQLIQQVVSNILLIVVGHIDGPYVHPTQDFPKPSFFIALSDIICCQDLVFGRYDYICRFQEGLHTKCRNIKYMNQQIITSYRKMRLKIHLQHGSHLFYAPLFNSLRPSDAYMRQ